MIDEIIEAVRQVVRRADERQNARNVAIAKFLKEFWPGQESLEY